MEKLTYFQRAQKGGKTRAARLSLERRREIAKKAALARWDKPGARCGKRVRKSKQSGKQES